MIEVKGRKGDLIKTTENGEVDNFNKKGEPNYQNIAKYAVNGAVHYAYAILNFTETYKEVVAIGVNGYEEANMKVYEVDVWYISKENLFVPKHVGRYDDLSFLDAAKISDFIQKLHSLSLAPEEFEESKLHTIYADVKRDILPYVTIYSSKILRKLLFFVKLSLSFG